MRDGFHFRQVPAAAVALLWVGLATAVSYVLAPFVPNLSLGVVYLVAVVAVALNAGLAYAVSVALAGMFSLVWFFLPRLHHLSLDQWQEWVTLVSYLGTMLLVAELAARARRRTEEALQRERETALLAAIARELLERPDVEGRLDEIAALLPPVLGVPRARLVLEPQDATGGAEIAYPVKLPSGQVGALYVPPERPPDERVVTRVLDALAGLLAIARDRERLTREALETESLRRADVAKTAILRSLSHDLRSPLTAIRTAAEGLLNGSPANGSTENLVLVESIIAEARRLERLVRDLLDLSRIEADALAPLMEVWAVDDLIAGALDAFGPSDSARVQVELPREIPLVRVDGVQIERTLANVIDNALKFSDASTTVDLAVERLDVDAVIRIRDRGPGIARSDSARIFEPFEQVGEAARSGAGLGLAIARGFAEANGACLRLSSTPGEGTVFTLSLPAVAAPVGVSA